MHTEVKLDNIIFDAELTTLDIDRLLVDDPARLNPPEESWGETKI